MNIAFQNGVSTPKEATPGIVYFIAICVQSSKKDTCVEMYKYFFPFLALLVQRSAIAGHFTYYLFETDFIVCDVQRKF